MDKKDSSKVALFSSFTKYEGKAMLCKVKAALVDEDVYGDAIFRAVATLPELSKFIELSFMSKVDISRYVIYIDSFSVKLQ